MSKYIIGLCIAAIALSGAVQAKGPKKISVTMNLNERFGAPATQGSKGYLVIDSVLDNRIQPEESGEAVSIAPQFADTQIGRILSENGHEHIILLKGTNIENFVRDVLTLQFNRAGYTVIPADDSGAADAVHVDVTLTSLWMWASKLEGSNSRKQFHFQMQPEIISETPELANIGAVEIYGFRNGSRITSWKSYNHTAMYAIKQSMNAINNAILESAVSKQDAAEPSSSATASLAVKLEELKSLLDANVITEEEYAAARAKVLDDFSK